MANKIINFVKKTKDFFTKNRLPVIGKMQGPFDLIGWAHGVLNINPWELDPEIIPDVWNMTTKIISSIRNDGIINTYTRIASHDNANIYKFFGSVFSILRRKILMDINLKLIKSTQLFVFDYSNIASETVNVAIGNTNITDILTGSINFNNNDININDINVSQILKSLKFSPFDVLTGKTKINPMNIITVGLNSFNTFNNTKIKSKYIDKIIKTNFYNDLSNVTSGIDGDISFFDGDISFTYTVIDFWKNIYARFYTDYSNKND